MDCGHSYRGSLNLAVGSGELLDRTETAAAKFTRHCVSPEGVRVNHSNQPHWRAFIGELMVNAGVVAAECAYTNHGDVYEVIGCQ
jgi:hypothetical protein